MMMMNVIIMVIIDWYLYIRPSILLEQSHKFLM